MAKQKTIKGRKTSAVIMAAGESSRFKPLSDKKHKALTRLGGKAIIRHTIENLNKNGIDDIILVHAPGERGKFEQELADINFGIKYAEQKEANGTGDALRAASHFIDSNFILMNAAHEDSEENLRKLLGTGGIKKSIKFLVSKSDRPWEYAVVEFDGAGKIRSLTEKPPKGEEKSDFRTVGLYLLTKEFIGYMDRAEDGPYSLINAFNSYIDHHGAEAVEADEPPSLKYAFDLIGGIVRFTDKIKRKIDKKADISKRAVLNGAVHIGKGTVIMDNAVIHGPVWIGENCVIGNNVVIRQNSVIENDVHLGTNTEIKRSHIGTGTHIHSGYVGDSVIGDNCRIGAGFITANRRIDRRSAKFTVGGKAIDSQSTYLGCVIGENTKIGIYASTMPGTIIGSNCIVGSQTEVKGSIESGTTIYTLKELVTKKKSIVNRKIVAFGGGTAMPSVVLPGLRKLPLEISTITSMTDSGGSTGALRKEFDIHAMGDIRRHILALSDAEEWKKDIWKFRFANDITFDDNHKGHNFANVFISGLAKNNKDFEKVLEITHKFMEVNGLCLPATMEKIQLHAELENGQVVVGEDDIDVARPNRDIKLKIAKIWLEPNATAYAKATDAIKEAEFIVIGPGDLYSSILPCFLSKGMKEAIASSKAKIIYIVNLLAKPGESYKFTANDHVKEVLKYIGRDKIDYLIVAEEKIGKDFIKANPEMKGHSAVKVDSKELQKNAGKIIFANPTNAEELGEVLAQIING